MGIKLANHLVLVEIRNQHGNMWGRSGQVVCNNAEMVICMKLSQTLGFVDKFFSQFIPSFRLSCLQFLLVLLKRTLDPPKLLLICR